MKKSFLILILLISNHTFSQFSKETQINIAFERIATENYTDALSKFNLLLNKYNDCYSCYYGRAKAKFYLKEFKGAEIDCEKSLNEIKDVQYNYALLGDIKYFLNDFKGSLKAYEKALSIQKNEDLKRNDGKEIIIDTKFYYIAKLKNNAIINKKPHLGKFKLNISFLDNVISKKLSVNDLYRHLFEYIVSWETKKYAEFNKKTGEHDLIVNTSEAILNYKGSKINLTIKSLENDENPIYYLKFGFNCKCDWFNIEKEATLNDYKKYEYSDNPDTRFSIFGGLDIKYKKGLKTLTFNKFHSKPYFDISLKQNKPKEKEPTSSDKYLSSAKVQYKSNSVMKAMEYVNKSIELDNKNADAYFFKSLILYDNIGYRTEFTEGSQTWETMKYLNKAIELNSTKSKYYFKRANLFKLLKEYDKSFKDLKKATNLNPKNIDISLELVEIMKEKKEYHNALEILNKTIEKNNKNSELYLQRALIKYEINDKNGACSDYNKAREIGFNKSGRLDLLTIMDKCR